MQKKILIDNGVGSAFFGSTGCGQLISISEKKDLLTLYQNEILMSKFL